MNFIRFSVLLVFATHLNSCGFFNKRKNNDSVPQTEWALHRPKLNDSLAKLKSVSSDRTLSAEHKFSQQWSAISDIFLSEEMQSANLLNLDFKKLKHDIEDIQSQNINSIYSQVNFDRKKPLIRLESHRAIRVPVKSYCLNHHRDAPSSSVRYKISTPKNESVLRRLILKYADDQYPTTEDLQGLIWKLEDSSSMVSSLQTLQKILKFYNIQFQNESVGELEKSSQLQEALVRLDLDKYADISQLEIDLISQNGFKSSDLIIYNKSTTTVDIHLSHLQQRFVPQYDLTTRSQVEPMAFGANGFSMMQNVEEEPHSNVQNILTSGHDKSRSDTTIEEYLNWLIIYLNLANDLQTHLKSKPNLENDVKNFSFGLFDLISHL